MTNNSKNISSFQALPHNFSEGKFSVFSCHLGADLYKQKDKGINLVVSCSVDNRWNPILVQNIELHPECLILIQMFEYSETSLSAGVVYNRLFKSIFLVKVEAELGKISQGLDLAEVT